MNELQFNLPDLGEGLHDAEIIQWHVAAGDHVVADQPLVSVETDKAVVEIPSPRSGRIASLCADEGERVAVGEPLLVFTDGEERDTGAVAGELPREAPTAAATTGAAPRSVAAGAGGHYRASPAARRLARELRLELESIHASGPDGVISVEDVQRAAHTAAPAEPPEWESLHGARHAMALRMAASHREVVPASVTSRALIRAWYRRERPLVRLIRALVHACRVEPALNCWFDAARPARMVHEKVNLGLAVDSPDGLFVPVLHGVERLDDEKLRERLDEAREAVFARRLNPAQLRDATISLSNFGSLGGEFAQMVIAPPQVAILGAGRITEQPVVRESALAVEAVLPLSLSFDHRAVTGGEAARFLEAVREHLEAADPADVEGTEKEPR